MLRSLRFRLTAVFLAGVVLAGLVAAALAFQLLKGYTLDRARADLRHESIGLTKLYRVRAAESNEIVPAADIERASGDTLFFIPRAEGGSIFPGGGLPLLCHECAELVGDVPVAAVAGVQVDQCRAGGGVPPYPGAGGAEP